MECCAFRFTTLFAHADLDGGVCSTCYSQADSPDPPVHPARLAAVSRRPTCSEHEHGQSLSPAQDTNSDNILLTHKRTVLWNPDFEAFRPGWWFEPALLDKVATRPSIAILRRSTYSLSLPRTWMSPVSTLNRARCVMLSARVFGQAAPSPPYAPIVPIA
jgi:hypothetical protein